MTTIVINEVTGQVYKERGPVTEEHVDWYGFEALGMEIDSMVSNQIFEDNSIEEEYRGIYDAIKREGKFTKGLKKRAADLENVVIFFRMPLRAQRELLVKQRLERGVFEYETEMSERDC